MNNNNEYLEFQAPSNQEFSGIFTPEIRKKFRCKRLQLGLSFANIGQFLGVNWSTVRKWEQGPTRSCSGFLVKKIQRFLAGGYDSVLNEKCRYRGDAGYYPHQIPEIVSQCSEKVANTYFLCDHHPDLRKELMENVVDITNSVLASLAQKPAEEMDEIDDDFF